jgi:hypothetical protein
MLQRDVLPPSLGSLNLDQLDDQVNGRKDCVSSISCRKICD